MMKNWVQFTITRVDKFNHKTNVFEDCEPYQYEKIGSDGVRSFDGRYSIETIKNICYSCIKKDNYLKLTGFKIYGSEWLKESNLLYKTNNTIL